MILLFMAQDLRYQIIDIMSLIAILPFATISDAPDFVLDSDGAARLYPSLLAPFYACR